MAEQTPNGSNRPADPGGSRENPVKFYTEEETEERDDECTVRIEYPPKRIPYASKKDNSGMKKSPSMGNFYLKRTTVNVQWRDVSLKTKKGIPILKNLSGAANSGELTAIMGPSGAGKTSLLNVLSGFTSHRVTGQILVNGVARDMRTFRKLTSYILQDDHLLPRLTVREIVTIAANLKIPSTISKREKENAVDDCICVFGLDSIQNQKANELSGGQRKRLCIAQELVSNPPLIFLDEPTSGLDSSSCLQCVQLLKALAEEGRTIICTIHQPSSKIYEIFDKLYMLVDGQCIYRGSTQNLVTFLSDQGLDCPDYHNPADYITEVVMGDYGDWNEKLKNAIEASVNSSKYSSDLDSQKPESDQGLNLQASTFSLLPRKCTDDPLDNSQEYLDMINSGFVTSSFNQFRVLFYRSFLNTLREPLSIHLKLVGNIVFGLLMGVLYFGIGNDATNVFSNTVLIFCTITLFIVCAQMPAALTFPMERSVFERERMNSWYSTRMYYLAITSAEFAFQLVYPIIGCSFIYWMTDQPSDPFRFGLFVVSSILVTLVAQSIGQLVGARWNVQIGIFISTIAAMYTVLFCGFFITFSSIPSYIRWLSYLSFGRFAFQSIVLILYSFDRPLLNCNNSTKCVFEDPMSVVRELEMEGELYMDYSVLLGFFLFFRIVTYFILKYRVMRMK